MGHPSLTLSSLTQGSKGEINFLFFFLSLAQETLFFVYSFFPPLFFFFLVAKVSDSQHMELVLVTSYFLFSR